MRRATWFLVGALALVGCEQKPSVPLTFNAVETFRYLGEERPWVMFFNGPALEELRARRPVWLKESDVQPQADRVRAMVQATQNPRLFRQLDRQEHFEVLLLAGDPIQSRPLLEHLWKSGDWSLEWADAFALVYRRGAQTEAIGSHLKQVREGWRPLENRERAERLALLGDRLVAAQRMKEAREVLDEAAGVLGGHPPVLAAEGRYRLERGEWDQAVSVTDRALRVDPSHRPSLSVKAQALYFSKRFREAYRISQRLLADSPGDPLMLFAHAKIAHEVGDYPEEKAVLQRLIEAAQDQKRSTAYYRVFLGRTMAKTGDGEGAIREFTMALQDPELPAKEREFAEDALKRVRMRLEELPPGL
jgi:tetratricopeptide (TPR) repeat protein